MKSLLDVTMKALFAKCPIVYSHSVQTARLSSALVERMRCHGIECGCSSAFAYKAGLLHDIGKLYIRDTILNKPEGLTEREQETMRLHPVWGNNFIQGTELECFSDVVVKHHENIDGSGYPYGIDGSGMNMVTRVIKIADKVLALAEDRPYRRGIHDSHHILHMLHPTIREMFVMEMGVELISDGILEYLEEFSEGAKLRTAYLNITTEHCTPMVENVNRGPTAIPAARSGPRKQG